MLILFRAQVVARDLAEDSVVLLNMHGGAGAKMSCVLGVAATAGTTDAAVLLPLAGPCTVEAAVEPAISGGIASVLLYGLELDESSQRWNVLPSRRRGRERRAALAHVEQSAAARIGRS